MWLSHHHEWDFLVGILFMSFILTKNKKFRLVDLVMIDREHTIRIWNYKWLVLDSIYWEYI